MAPDAKNNLMQRLQVVAEPTPYPAEAFLFVLACAPRPAEGHCTTAELRQRIHATVVDKFGDQARDRLELWSIHSFDDFGAIVFAMFDAGLMAQDDHDSLTDFQNQADFQDAFPANDGRPRSPRRFQWRISTLFLITTIGAIAFAGFGQFGITGAIRTLVGAWLALIGGAMIALTLANRSQRRLIELALGIAFVIARLAIFLFVILNIAVD